MNEAIPMRLNCPECGMLHVDQGEFATRIHHTHSCQSCGLTWRPCVLPTVGVQHLPGFKDDDPTPGLHDVRVVSAARLRELEQISLQYGEALAKKMLADDRSEKAERNLATWNNEYECPCMPCQEWLRRLRADCGPPARKGGTR